MTFKEHKKDLIDWATKNGIEHHEDDWWNEDILAYAKEYHKKQLALFNVSGWFSDGFKIDVVPNHAIQEGGAKLLVNPKDMPKQ